MEITLCQYHPSHFSSEVTVADTFVQTLYDLNEVLQDHSVVAHPQSSFRSPGVGVSRSNHFVGHAIDWNLEKQGVWYNSKTLHSTNLTELYRDLRSITNLRLGVDFSRPSPVHIDDGLNKRDPALYNLYYDLLWDT